MKNLFKLLLVSLLPISVIAQNSITTPTGTPLTIGNNGVKLANLTSASTPSTSNNLALSVDATGNIILVPAAASGGGNPSFRVQNTSNTMGGTASGNATVNGIANTFFGFNAGYSTGINAAGSQNSFFGANAGNNTTDGANNTFFGAGTGVYNTLGSNNTFLGLNTGANNRTGSNNVMIGINAGYDGTATVKNTSYNTYIGNFTGQNTNANFNTFIGYASGLNNTTGTNNIWVGAYAGGHATVTNNSSCIFIGDQSGPWLGTNHAAPDQVFNNLTNASAIGVRARCTVSNAMVLGGIGIDAVKVGIGIHNPSYPLDVKGLFNLRAQLNSPTIKVNDRNFLELDEKGEYVLNSFKMKYSDVNQWSDKVFEKKYKLLTIKQLGSYIQQNRHLPNIPSANEVVSNGVRQDELNAKLLEKIEELSLYIISLEKRVSQVEKK
jgi:trimeric autotransporter adhesin